jgi:uncharacterized DUF497 family protein
MTKTEFDPEKDAVNRAKHGVSLDRAAEFDWSDARIKPDARRDYGEPRFIGTGWIGRRLHVMVFTRRGDVVRIINLRKANARERKRHAQEEAPPPH